MDGQHIYQASASRNVVANVHELLKMLSQQHNLEPLKKLFWYELHYERANEPLSCSRWPEATARLLAEEPLLLATGYDNFPIIYGRLAAGELRTCDERTVVTQLMKGYANGLFIFSDQSRSRWHFVNVKADDKNTKRRLFRRITIGPEEHLRIASERIALLDLASIQSVSLLAVIEQHERAFDVEAVTRRFFDDYRTLFSILQQDLRQQTNDKRWAHDYALQLLNRCMFLSFIQRKGWPGHDNNFLGTFWTSYHSSTHEKDSFFRQWLQALFFEAFNNQFHGGYNYFPQHIHNILAMAPYLNGGLFSRNKLDTADTPFTLSDACFEQIFHLLEGYNFTITEDSPLDQEVAVDPEMLGRVYESLVNVSDELDERSDAGIFYTPRTEIDLMCRLALVDYLTHYVGEQNKSLLYHTIFALEPEEKIQADAALQAHHLWDDLYDPLQQVTVFDPACGSGAFLVGMLQVLNDLQERAARYRHGVELESDYARKKRIIEQSLYGVDALEWAAHIAELRLWLALVIDVDIPLTQTISLPSSLTCNIRCGDSLIYTVRPAYEAPSVSDSLLAEFFSGKGFDIVIGNPPYVRQEHISNPMLPRDEVTRENKQDYKKLLADTVYHDFPEFFQFRQGVGKAGHPIDAKSDLYIYFYLHGLRLLNSKGSFCFITSNSWLDVGYGADLQEFLLKYCRINMILDNQARRSFATADVNTTIALFSAPTEKPTAEALNHLARFVMFKVGFEQVLTAETFISIEQAQERTTTPAYRVYPIRQSTLLEEGYAQQETEEDEESSQKSTKKHLIKEAKASYSSNKWGGKYLRAPDIYWTLLEKGRGKLARLGEIAQVRRGITTGANEFFYLDETKIRQWGIEEEFLQPVIKSPRECRSILIDPAAVKTNVFICHKSKAELKGTAALKYIQWGESKKYDRNSTCLGRARWWSLTSESGNSLFVKEANDTSAVFYNPDKYIVDCRLYYADIPIVTLLYLNSVVGVMLFEIYNRAGLGEGARSMMVSDYAQVPSLITAHVDQAKNILQGIYSLPPRKLVYDTVSRSAWADVDHLVFSTLGLTRDEQDAVYEAVIGLVEARIKKASSLPRKKG